MDIKEFYHRYRTSGLLSKAEMYTSRLSAKDLSILLLSKIPEVGSNFVMGKSKIFLKEYLRPSLEECRNKGVISYVISMQKIVRGYLTRKDTKAMVLANKKLIDAMNRRDQAAILEGLKSSGFHPSDKEESWFPNLSLICCMS
jgi:myosin heavy subunit